MMMQPKDYSYIGLAGEQVSRGMRDFGNVLQQEEKIKKNKYDLETLENARQQRIEEAYNEYLEASGDESDEGKRKAYVFISQILPPAMGKERDNPDLMRDRLIEADKRFYVELANIKEKRYVKETGHESMDVKTDKLGGNVSMGEPAVTGQGGTGKLSTMPTLAGMQQRELYAPPSTPNVDIPTDMSARDRYELAKKYQITDRPSVKADIDYASQTELAEQDMPQGALRGDVAREAAKLPGSTKPMEGIVSSYPTEKDVMTDRRLREAAEARANAAKERNRIAELNAKIKQNKATKDEWREMQDSKINAMAKRDNLIFNITKLEADLVKANKLNKYEDPELKQKDVADIIENLAAQRKDLVSVEEEMNGWDTNIKMYDEMMKNKGYTPQSGTKPQTQGTPSRAGFDAWKASRGQ